jgi:uncharacterized protein
MAFSDQAWAADLVAKVEIKARDLLADSPACHDWDHSQRVWRTAKQLAILERAELLVVEVAALLHDIGRVAELRDQGQTCHAQLGAAMTPSVLAELGVDCSDFVAAVTDCVRSHRYRQRDGATPPQSLEAKIVYDADKLDSLGAIGIGRAFHFAGRIGARVHNLAQEALNSDSYSVEDSAYREYLVKLRHLHEAMLTASGRAFAQRRHRFMVEFFAQINREVRGEDFML